MSPPGYLLVPVLFCSVEGGEHNGEYFANILTYETEDIFIVPVV